MLTKLFKKQTSGYINFWLGTPFAIVINLLIYV